VTEYREISELVISACRSSSLMVTRRCNETLLSSAVTSRRHHRASAARPWNRASRNLIINASTSVSVAPGSSELAEQKEEGKNERGRCEQKKGLRVHFRRPRGAGRARPRARQRPSSSALSRQRPLDSRSHGCARAHASALRVPRGGPFVHGAPHRGDARSG